MFVENLFYAFFILHSQLAKMVSKYFQEQEQKEQKAEEEEGKKLKKIASQIAKHVKEFWSIVWFDPIGS
jgi:S-methylmethionine-dependent homocysteine/selenocysteine methylase